MPKRKPTWLHASGSVTRSLRFQMSLGMTLFIVLVSTLLSTLFVVSLETNRHAASRRLARETASLIAARLELPVRTGDHAGIRARLDGVLRDPRVLWVVVSTPSGDITRIDERCPDEDAPRPGRSPPPSGAVRIEPLGATASDPVEAAVRIPGTDDQEASVRVGFALGAGGTPVDELRWRAVMITLAMIVLGGAGTMFLVGRVVGPIQDLAAGTESILRGDLDVQVPEDSEGEVGVLARSFNRMAARLRTALESERALSRDLEQRVRIKTREISETREHLSNIVENVGASILVAGLDGTIVSANTHTMHIFGSKPEFTVGRRLEEFLCRGDLRLPELRERLERTGTPSVYDARWTLEPGHELELLITHTLLRDAQEYPAGILQITKDITELRRMERRLVSSERLSAMGEMAGEIGHELNNYLMAIGGRAELILAALERGEDGRSLAKVEKSAALIAGQIAEMRRLTDGLLESARKESSPQDVDLVALVRSTVDFVRPQNRYDRIRFSLGGTEEPLRARVDPQQMRQVVLNLLANAADATLERHPEGGEIRVEVFRDDDGLGFRVSDDGVGIDGPTRERLFEPRFTTKTTGNGFGLAVCHRVVDNHGGRIHVRSIPGQGASFTVNLPQTATVESRDAAAPAPP